MSCVGCPPMVTLSEVQIAANEAVGKAPRPATPGDRAEPSESA